MKRIQFKAIALLLALLALAMASGALAEAAPQWTAQWKYSKYADGELNSQTFCTLQTEYPVYKTGVTSAFLLLKNNMKRPLLYGLFYTLEKKQADGWYAREVASAAPDAVVSFPAIGLGLRARATHGLQTGFFLPLEAGEYRIVKSVGFDDSTPYESALFCAYFRVADDGYDPTYLSGYAPLSVLPGEYFQEQALHDGCFYVDSRGRAHNADKMGSFLTKAQQGVEAKVRLLRYTVEGAAVPVDISYRTGSLYQSRFLLEQDFTRDRCGANGVIRKYFPYLTLRSMNGKTVLQLSEWTGKRLDGAEEFTVCDAKAVGKRGLAKLIRPYEVSETAEFCVYSPSGGNSAYSNPSRKDEAPQISYQLADGTNASIQLPEGVSIGMLRDMEWTAEDMLSIAFVSTQGIRYTALFDANTRGVTLRKGA